MSAFRLSFVVCGDSVGMEEFGPEEFGPGSVIGPGMGLSADRGNILFRGFMCTGNCPSKNWEISLTNIVPEGIVYGRLYPEFSAIGFYESWVSVSEGDHREVSRLAKFMLAAGHIALTGDYST